MSSLRADWTHYRKRCLARLTFLYEAEEADRIFSLLLEHYFGQPWYQLALDYRRLLQHDTQAFLQEAITRLFTGEPVQHILGEGHFYGRQFKVSPAVLIPRQETEELLVWARDSLLRRPKTQPAHLLDIGTGSGCLITSLLLEGKAAGRQWQGTGLDVSEAALNLAQENAQTLGASVDWRQLDILQAPDDAFTDLTAIVSNPPYVPEAERLGLAPHVRDHEPELALFVPDEDPLIFYRTIGQLGLRWLAPGGWLFFEVHAEQGQAVVDLLEGQGYEAVQLRQDLNGRDRMVRAERSAH